MKNPFYYLRNFVFTRCFTPHKFLNLIRATIEYETKRDVLASRPYYLVLDPCNCCILKCPLCPTGRGDDGRTKGLMSFDHYRGIVDELKDSLYEIYLFNWGEPLLNKDIFRMIRYARDNRIRTRLSSNLNHFAPGFAREIVSSGLDHLVISLDGTSQQSYEIYRRGGSFAKVVNAVKQIVSEKTRQHSTTPRLIWQFLVMRHNENELAAARALARELDVDELAFTGVRTDTAKWIFQTDEEKIEGGKQWLPQNDKLSRFDYRKKCKTIRTTTCKFLWSMPAINPNGSVSPCCAVFPERYDFGNVLEQGFASIWNNDKFVAARRAVRGKACGVPTVCVTCAKNGFV